MDGGVGGVGRVGGAGGAQPVLQARAAEAVINSPAPRMAVANLAVIRVKCVWRCSLVSSVRGSAGVVCVAVDREYGSLNIGWSEPFSRVSLSKSYR